MLNQLLASKKLARTTVNEALRRTKKAGIEKPELEAFLGEMTSGRQKIGLAYCTDAEALRTDRVTSEVLIEHPGLTSALRQRYEGRGMTRRRMAELLNDVYLEWCFSTHEKRIVNRLTVTEYALYTPIRESLAQKIAGFLTHKLPQSRYASQSYIAKQTKRMSFTRTRHGAGFVVSGTGEPNVSFPERDSWQNT